MQFSTLYTLFIAAQATVVCGLPPQVQFSDGLEPSLFTPSAPIDGWPSSTQASTFVTGTSTLSIGGWPHSGSSTSSDSTTEDDQVTTVTTITVTDTSMPTDSVEHHIPPHRCDCYGKRDFLGTTFHEKTFTVTATATPTPRFTTITVSEITIWPTPTPIESSTQTSQLVTLTMTSSSINWSLNSTAVSYSSTVMTLNPVSPFATGTATVGIIGRNA
ncbi:hypothetical protein F4861DRAFT_550394 [Xylaria intraflava]|nr:hypothetical protein F4861DRAFT_550394 [Xylaria intraflava]